MEVHERLNDAGVYCSLFYGSRKTKCPSGCYRPSRWCRCKSAYDVAVIDEIQLIGSSEGGHSWTRALLGLDALERSVRRDALELVEDLQKMWRRFVLKTYERLTPLKPLPVLKAGATSELATAS